MQERKGRSSYSSVPGNAPISSVSDSFGRLNRSKRELEVPKSLDFEVVVCRRELSTEDGVEVDGFPGNNIFRSESGNSGQAVELVSDLLVILCDRVVVSELSVPDHAKADSSTLDFLNTHSSFDERLSTSSKGDCVASCS